MTGIGKWNTPTAATTVLTTEINSLTTNTMTAASAAVNNDTALNMYVDIELNLAAFSPTGGYFSVYIAEAVDGTNFPTPSAADMRLSPSQLLASLPTGTTAATAQRVVARNVLIPPAKFKLYLDNQSGATTAASGSTLSLLSYNVNLNG